MLELLRPPIINLLVIQPHESKINENNPRNLTDYYPFLDISG